MSSGSPPPRPQPVSPPEEWPHYHLYLRVKKAIAALPIHFATDTHIEGISATDIFTLNTALGATIEEQVVATLNRIRTTWDPDGGYALYRFDRQPQTFPDVVLRRLSHVPAEDREIIMGIELKGWYLLSKEGEPSFRYRITGAACADADLLVVVPWVLKNVVSGQPRVLDPYVRPAKYAAEARNHYWQYGRTTSHSTEVIHPEGPVSPYGPRTDQRSDRARYDPGGNFGRYARTGEMDDYKNRVLGEPVCGIPARAWLDFFKLFTESATDQDVAERIAGLRARLSEPTPPEEPCACDVYLQILDVIERSL